MSGGHFEDKNYGIEDVCSTIECDIETNNIKQEEDPRRPGYYTEQGLGWSDEAIEYAKLLVAEIREIADIVHRYDWVASGDCSEEHFVEAARKRYGPKETPGTTAGGSERSG